MRRNAWSRANNSMQRTALRAAADAERSAGRRRPAERAAAEPRWLRPPAAAEPAAGTDGPAGHGSAAAR